MPWTPIAPIAPCCPGGPCWPGSPLSPFGPGEPRNPSAARSSGVSLGLHAARAFTAPFFVLQSTSALASVLVNAAASTSAITTVIRIPFLPAARRRRRLRGELLAPIAHAHDFAGVGG